MKLPNSVSILLGVVLVAALTALAGELPTTAEGWLPLAAAAIVGGVAKAVQVWLDAQRDTARMAAQPRSKLRHWLIG